MKKLIIIGLCLLILCPVFVQSKDKKNDIICTTMDLQRKYKVISITRGFSIEMLRSAAKTYGGDAVIGVRMVMLPNFMSDPDKPSSENIKLGLIKEYENNPEEFKKNYGNFGFRVLGGDISIAHLYYGTIVRFIK